MIRTAIILFAATLSGCGGVNRWEAYRDVRLAEEITNQAALSAPSPTITITTMDSAGRPVTVTADLAQIIRAVTGNSAGSNRSAPPPGAGAEMLNSLGRAATDILSTPAAVGGVVGASVVGAINSVGGGATTTTVGGDQIGGDYSTTTTTTNTTETIQPE